jgi:hypothetical protein
MMSQWYRVAMLGRRMLAFHTYCRPVRHVYAHTEKKCATLCALQTSMFTMEASRMVFMESLGAMDVSFETVLFGI